MSDTRRSPELEDPAALLQLVMDNIPQFIFWKDRQSVYLGCNQNFAEAAGVGGPEEIVGKTDFDLAWKEEEARFFREVDERVMSSDTPEYKIIEPQQQADGKHAWLETNKIPLHDEAGNVVGILGTFEDITARRQAEAALRESQKMESIGRLAGGVAHDFNNMLGGILGAADLLRNEPTGEDAEEMLDLIVRSARRAAELTAKLLTFSRRGAMESRPVDLHAVIRDALTLLARSSDPRLVIEQRLSAGTATVLGDPSEFEAAVLNLGINARDAMPQGGVLTVSTEVQVFDRVHCERSRFPIAPGSHLRITVRDEGTGMTPDVLERAFEPFFTTKPRGAGTGLGLAAVYGAVTEHRGAVELESTPGQGTTVTVLLPLHDAPVKRSPAPRVSSEGRGAILVVDDEDVIRRTTALALRELGFRVLTARDGVAGVETFRERHRDIEAVLLDVLMPRMDGLTCLAELQRIAPDVRVVLMSGYTSERLSSDVAAMAGVSFLKKPFGHAELAAALELRRPGQSRI